MSADRAALGEVVHQDADLLRAAHDVLEDLGCLAQARAVLVGDARRALEVVEDDGRATAGSLPSTARALAVVAATLGVLVPGVAVAQWGTTAAGQGGARAGTWEEPTCTPGEQTVTASANAHVLQSNPGANFGGTTVLQVGMNAQSSIIRAFVRFPAVEIPPGCQVTGAALLLRQGGTHPITRTLVLQPVTGDWTEDGLTYATQPGVAAFESWAFNVASGQDVFWNVPAPMLALATHGFRVTDQHEEQAGVTNAPVNAKC